MTGDPIVILGTGLAGYSLARELRKLDQNTDLVLLSRDQAESYSKPMLSNALAQGKTPEQLVNAEPAVMAEQLKAQILANQGVQAIDPERRRCVLTHGESIRYRDLVLALGADPIRLSFAGDAADSVLSINDLDDYRRFRAALAGAQRVLIIGAGLIGCEFANDLFQSGYQVSLVDLAEQPLGRLVPPQLAQGLQTAFASAGVDWYLGHSVVSVNQLATGYRVELDNGQVVETDLVLSAIGLRPRLQLAQQAGLAVERGIQVNRRMQTSNLHIYALGDCAAVEGLLLPFVMPIMHAARALAKTLTGTPTEVVYPAMPVVVKTPAHPVVVAPPPRDATGQWQEIATPSGVQAEFRGTDGDLLGFALSGTAVGQKQALSKQLPPTLA